MCAQESSQRASGLGCALDKEAGRGEEEKQGRGVGFESVLDSLVGRRV